MSNTERWDVEFTNDFGAWWEGLTEDRQDKIAASVGLLEQYGPNLGYPHASKVNGSKHRKMRELRVQYRGAPIRIFYAFDPRQTAILLIGGDKTGNDRFYLEMAPLADQLYDEHLIAIRGEIRGKKV